MVYADAVETVGETVGEEVLKGTSALIVDSIKANPRITREELAKQADLSVRGIEYQLKKLRASNIIKRVGPTKGGYWEVSD